MDNSPVLVGKTTPYRSSKIGFPNMNCLFQAQAANGLRARRLDSAESQPQAQTPVELIDQKALANAPLIDLGTALPCGNREFIEAVA
jgi:hypothetical protein